MIFKGNIFNSLPNDRILDVTKLKEFADDKLNIAKMTLPVFDTRETLEKEKMLVTGIFSLYRTTNF